MKRYERIKNFCLVFLALTLAFTSVESVQRAAADDAYAVSITVDADADVTSTINGLTDGLCSWQGGGQDAETSAGNDYAFAPVIYINNNEFESGSSLTDEIISSTELADTSVIINREAVNGIIINNSAYTIDHCKLEVNADSADGSTTCDFSGLGSAVAVYGSSDVVIENSVLKASGVADLGIFVDNGARVLLKNVALTSLGGTLYAGYSNSPAQETMVAPPWILGIMGNSRVSNLMGTRSTLTVIDSDASASYWAVLSADSGSEMVLNVVNSSLTLTGSDQPIQADGKFDAGNPYTSRNGYGAYIIGDCTERFLGVTMNVGTYAAIFTGGTAEYGNLTAGNSYDLADANGTIHTTYTATEDRRTILNSDTFGFMAHQGTNTCILDGVEVNSEFTGFLVKSGNDTTITVKNGASLHPGNGILLQLLDNDDSTTAFDSETQAFGESHEEYAGFPTEAVTVSTTADSGAESDQPQGEPADGMPEKNDGSQVPPEKPAGDENSEGHGPAGTEPMPTGETESDSSADSTSGSNTTVYNIIDTQLEGSIYNGIGWKANDLSNENVKPMQLQVNLSGTAALQGAIAMTSCIHATYDGQIYLKENGITAFNNADEAADFAEQYQATSFDQSEYYNIGQVANLVLSNGLNNIDVHLSDSAVWTVTGTSLVTSVTLSGDARVIVESGVTLTVNGKIYTEGTYTDTDF